MAPRSAAEQQLALAREIASSFEAGDPAAVERFFHPDVEFHDAWAIGDGEYRGHEGVRRLYGDFAATWENFRFELLELEPTPDGRVFMAGRQSVKRRSTSREIERTMYFLLEFRDGKLVKWDGWHLRPIARGAAGLAD
jgi:uncharacterized protein